MLTDDDLAARVRRSFAGTLEGVVPKPDLLSRVRHDHVRSVRRQRLLVPAGVTVLGLGAFVAWPAGGGRPTERLGAAPTPSASPSPEPAGPTVTLFDYHFTLPSGFVVDSVEQVDLAKADPPQPVHGESAFFSAHKGLQQLGVTVYRGPIADAEATVQIPSSDAVRTATIAGFPSKSYSYAAGGPQCLTKENGRTLMRVEDTGPCSQEGSETRVTTAPHEQVWANAQDVPLTEVDAMLESGLA